MTEITTEPLENLKAQLKTAAEGRINIREVAYTSQVEATWVNRQLEAVKSGKLPITEMYVAVEKLIVAMKSFR